MINDRVMMTTQRSSSVEVVHDYLAGRCNNPSGHCSNSFKSGIYRDGVGQHLPRWKLSPVSAAVAALVAVVAVVASAKVAVRWNRFFSLRPTLLK